MAKRHASLIALSHDHHHGLAVALRLKQGDKALLTDGWTHDPAEQATRVERFYNDNLRLHFRAEEEELFPAMLREIPHTSELIEALVRQHRELERMVQGISPAGKTSLPDLLIGIGDLLDRHIRIEERELFPIFEAEMPAELAELVGDQIRQIRGKE